MTAAPDSATLEKLLVMNPHQAPWIVSPWRIDEGPFAVKDKSGDYVCNASADIVASLIAAAPDLAAEVLALRAENAELEATMKAAVAECGALMIVGDALADVLDRPVQSDGKLGQYCYRWGAVDAALAAYREARK